jgi:hypothetical protein
MVRYAAVVPAFKVNVEIVWFSVKLTLLTPVIGRPINDKVEKVLAPVIVTVTPPEGFVKLTLLKVRPPDAIPVVVTPDRLICEVPAFHVRPVVVAKLSAVAEIAEIVIMLEPSEIDRVLELLELKFDVEMLKLPLLNEPFVMVSVPVIVSGLPSVQPPPTPLKDTDEDKLTPFVVIVLPVVVAVNMVKIAPHTVPAIKDIDPAMLSVAALLANVTVPAETVMSKQFNVPVIVTV